MSASDRNERRAQKASSVAPASLASAPPTLSVVSDPSPEQLQQAEWEALELRARADRQGVDADSLKPKEAPKENWREKLVKQAPPPSPAYAGLYHLTGGSLWMGHDAVAIHDSYIQLSAVDGKHVTDRGIGVRVSSGDLASAASPNGPSLEK